MPSVPEVAITENGHPAVWQNNIRLARQSGEVDAVSKANAL